MFATLRVSRVYNLLSCWRTCHTASGKSLACLTTELPKIIRTCTCSVISPRTISTLTVHSKTQCILCCFYWLLLARITPFHSVMLAADYVLEIYVRSSKILKSFLLIHLIFYYYQIIVERSQTFCIFVFFIIIRVINNNGVINQFVYICRLELHTYVCACH